MVPAATFIQKAHKETIQDLELYLNEGGIMHVIVCFI